MPRAVKYGRRDANQSELDEAARRKGETMVKKLYCPVCQELIQDCTCGDGCHLCGGGPSVYALQVCPDCVELPQSEEVQAVLDAAVAVAHLWQGATSVSWWSANVALVRAVRAYVEATDG